MNTKMGAATLALLAFVTAVVYVSLSAFEREKMISAKEQAARMAEQLFIRAAAVPVVFEDETGIHDTVALLLKDPEVLGVELWKVAPDRTIGKKLATELKVPSEPGARPGPLAEGVDIDRADDRIIVRDAVRDPDGKVVAVAAAQFSLARENAAFDDLRTKILLAAGGVALFVGALLWFVTRRSIVLPLTRLLRAVRQVEAGEQVDLATSAAHDEVGRLADAFGRMADAVARRERDIARRNDDMKLVLDNVGQGFLVFDGAGVLAAERSAIVDRWFGPPAPGSTIAEYMLGIDAKKAPVMRLGIESIADGFLPLALCVEQLPRRLDHRGRTYECEYHPILVAGTAETVRQMVLVISDVTAEVERDRAERAQKDLVAAVSRLMADKSGFLDFLKEAGELVAAIASAPDDFDRAVMMRDIHTLKGIAAIFGLTTVATYCHTLEDQTAETGLIPSAEARALLRDTWTSLREKIAVFGTTRRGIEISPEEYRAFAGAVRARVPYSQIMETVEQWTQEPVKPRLERLGEHADALAKRLGKAELDVKLVGGALRLPNEPWSQLWHSLVHVVRNAVDHGIETTAQRVAAGKPERATLTLAVTSDEGDLAFEVSDDGCGVNWDALRGKATAAGMRAETEDDLIAAMLSDGVSTRTEITETSGRGVGLAAVRQLVESLGGRLRVRSTVGQGTAFHFDFPGALLATRSLSRRLGIIPDVAATSA